MIDMPVEMTFRRWHADKEHGILGCFWKVKPVAA